MGVLVEDLLTLARLDEVADAPHAEVDLSALAARRGRRRARDRARPRDRAARDGGAAPCSATPTSCARCSPTSCATRSCTRRPGRRSRCRVGARGRTRARSRCATTARACRPSDPDALFERFWRAEGGRERGRAGAGLGLAIVAGIVDAHGGRVSAANAAGGGALVRGRCSRLAGEPRQLQGPLPARGRGRCWGHDERSLPAPPGGPPVPPTSRSSCRSTTRRARSSARSAACTASWPTSSRSPGGSAWPTTRAPTARSPSRARWPRARGVEVLHLGARAAAARCARPGGSATRSSAYMDVDLSTDLRALLPLVAPLLSGHSDLAIGTRLAHGARVVRGPSASSSRAPTTASCARALRARFSDAQCGSRPAAPGAAPSCCPRCATTLVLRHRAARAGPAARHARARGSVDWVDDPDSRVTSSHRARRPARRRPAAGRQPVARFIAIGIASTLAYALLYLAAARPLGAGGANALALAVTAVANTPPTAA